MRLIEEKMWEAIDHQDRLWVKQNTGVEYKANYDEALIYLHGHHIATYDYETEMARANITTLRKYPTRTTMSRLRALRINVYTRNGSVYLNDWKLKGVTV
tara:strand:+ start:195 stop:494 length:300 start_codon:yes stop_codon:yes gene_type:complete